MRILVVDDEQIVIESVTQTLKNKFPDADIESARNSREGLIKLEHFRPQIILTDIKMPGMNGLELIERIRKANTVVKIIIVSAHDHFEYAKEAVRFNVEDYLLKPLSKNKLIETIENVYDKIKNEEVLRNKELDHIEKYYQSIQLVESNFFNSILLGRNYMKYVGHYREILEMQMKRGYFVVIEFTTYTSKTDVEALNTFNQKMNACSEYLRTEVKYQLEALVSHPFLNRIVVYVEEAGKGLESSYWNLWVSQVLDKFMLKIRIGIGSVQEIGQIHESYGEALIALKLSDGDVIRSSQIKNQSGSSEALIKSAHAILEGFVSRNKSFYAALSTFEGHYLKLIQNSMSSEYAEAVLIESLVKINTYYNQRMTMPSTTDIPKHYLLEIIKLAPVSKLQAFEKMIKEWYAIYSRMHDSNYSPITKEAMEYIQLHFSNDLTLDQIASTVNVTPQYLSKIFKEDTGFTYKDFLTEQRIEESKRLLRENRLSIKDICESVGYNDTNYFIRAFKKYEGLTPKDYQRLNK